MLSLVEEDFDDGSKINCNNETKNSKINNKKNKNVKVSNISRDDELKVKNKLSDPAEENGKNKKCNLIIFQTDYFYVSLLITRSNTHSSATRNGGDEKKDTAARKSTQKK